MLLKETNADSQPAGNPRRKRRGAKRQTKSQKRWRKAIMLFRRIHLYSGLFMLPWVLMYGFTGWFFNHPRYFTGDERRPVSPTQLADSALANLPAADAVAARVVEEINLASFAIGGPEVELAESTRTQYSGYMTFNVNADKQTHVIVLHPETGAGEVRTTHAPDTEKTTTQGEPPRPIPLADIDQVEAGPNAQSSAAAAIPGMLGELGLEAAEAFPRRGGISLSFDALIDGEPARISYRLAGGDITAQYADAPKGEIPVKSFLQRLHLSRGYRPNLGIRSWWALSVDAMFLSMVFWGLSGVLMWWQLKQTRFSGVLVLIASLVCTVVLTVGMHEELKAGRRGGGNRGGRSAASPAKSAEKRQSPANQSKRSANPQTSNVN